MNAEAYREGRVIEAKNSFFYVDCGDETMVCKLRGRFKSNKGENVYVGDTVRISSLADGSGVVEELLPRKNLLVRPPIANVNGAVIVLAAKEPDFNSLLLDRFIALAEHSHVERIIIAVNKIDLIKSDVPSAFLLPQYERLGCKVFGVSAHTGAGLATLTAYLRENPSSLTVFTGASGVGKSSLINALFPNAGFSLAVGQVSGKIKRGRHTTRVAKLLKPTGENFFVVDTPGFSSVDLTDIDTAELPWLFREFSPFVGRCRFCPCTHSHEPNCAVKAAAENGDIEPSRYDAYLDMLNSMNERRKRNGN